MNNRGGHLDNILPNHLTNPAILALKIAREFVLKINIVVMPMVVMEVRWRRSLQVLLTGDC